MMWLNLTNANASLSRHAIRNSNAASVPSASFLRKQSCLCIAISNYVSLWGTRTPTCLITCKFKEAGYLHIWKFTPM